MKNYLNQQWIFYIGLWILSLIARVKFFDSLTHLFTSIFARMNLFISKPNKSEIPKELAEKWKALMPFDKQDSYKVTGFDDITATTEIHICCPLRGSDNVQACYKLMNYDRTLMDAVGGNLIVLESQSNSGKDFCKLAIRKKGVSTMDLIPAHLISQENSQNRKQGYIPCSKDVNRTPGFYKGSD